MTVLLGSAGNVDFEVPLRLTAQQRAGLKAFLETQFAVVEEQQVRKFRERRLGDGFFARDWTERELAQLLDWRVPQEETARRLGRTVMSVQMQAGNFTPGFLRWCKGEGHDPSKDDVERLISLYLAQRALAKIARRQAKLERTPSHLRKRLRHAQSVLATFELMNRGRGGRDADLLARIGEVRAEIEELAERLASLEISGPLPTSPLVPPSQP